MRREKAAEELDIEGYWRDATGLPELPEFLYRAERGYSIRQMAIKRLRCYGERTNAPYHHHRSRAVWIASEDCVLWAGSEYAPSRFDVPGKRYAYAKENVDLTLEAAVERLNEFAAAFEASYVADIERVAQEIKRYEAEKDRLADRLLEAESFHLTAKDVQKLAKKR